MEKRLIDLNKQMKEWSELLRVYFPNMPCQTFEQFILNSPTVDAVEVEKYNDLREAFVDFVCSGVPNPAPYCKNRCHDCIDSRGWCVQERCTGFNPDGERRSEDAK